MTFIKSSQNLPYKVNHIGIAVRSIEKAFEFYKALGWTSMKTEVVESEKVRVGFVEFANEMAIELLEPTSDDSTIAKFIEKRGEGIHHICIEVPNVNQNLDQLKKKGYKLVHEKAKPGAQGCMIAFIHPSSTNGVLLELSQMGGPHE